MRISYLFTLPLIVFPLAIAAFEDDDALDIYVRDADPDPDDLGFEDVAPAAPVIASTTTPTPARTRAGFRRSAQIAKVKREEREQQMLK